MGWYLVITEEMRQMGLSGNELLVYALINGYSQKGQGCYWGSLATASEICGVSSKTIQRCLQSLVESGFIRKNKIIVSDDVRIAYYANRISVIPSMDKMSMGGQIVQEDGQNVHGVVDKMSNNNKDIKESIKNISLYKGGFDFLQSLISLGVSEDVAKAFLQVRKEKKATNTEVAFNGLKREIERASVYFQKTPDDCIRLCVENSWKGFKADWLNESQRQSRPAQPQRRESVMEHNMRALDQMFGTDYHNQYYGNPKPQTPDYDEQ